MRRSITIAALGGTLLALASGTSAQEPPESNIAACFLPFEGTYMVSEGGRPQQRRGTILGFDPRERATREQMQSPGCLEAGRIGAARRGHERQQVDQAFARVMASHRDVTAGLGGYRTAHDGLMAARGNLDTEHAAIEADFRKLSADYAAQNWASYRADLAAYKARAAEFDRALSAYLPRDEAFAREWGGFATKLDAHRAALANWCSFIGGRMASPPAIACNV